MPMYKKVYFIACFFLMRFVAAQFHEIGIFLGGSNYIGDIGSHRYIDPNEFAYGVLYKWNVTDRYSLRSGVTFSNLNENEFRNTDINRFRRSYKVTNPIQEITAGVEINFKEFNLHDPEFSFTPYIFYGLGYFRHDQPYLISNGPINPPSINVFSKDRKIAIPLSFGFKIIPILFIVLGFEIGARYTLTDNLDGSNPSVEILTEYPSALEFGNFSNNDWYIFTGLTISFTFGDLPCYCKE